VTTLPGNQDREVVRRVATEAPPPSRLLKKRLRSTKSDEPTRNHTNKVLICWRYFVFVGVISWIVSIFDLHPQIAQITPIGVDQRNRRILRMKV